MLPTVLVIWGLSIWLGWPGLIWGLAAPLRLVGLAPEAWSLAACLNALAALIWGFLVFPLLFDTLRVSILRGRWRKRPVMQALSTGRLLGCFAVIALTACALDRSGFVAGRGLALSAILGPPPPDPETGESQTFAEASLSDWRKQGGGIGQEFMPPLDEGDFLYMPSVLPAGSINTVLDVMQKQDVQFARIPEVETVVGKLGRIESALDPAPVGMLETVIALRPRQQWPLIDDPEHPGRRRRRTMNEIWDEIKAAGRYPGVLPSVQLQPIRARVEMLSTGGPTSRMRSIWPAS